MWGEMRVYVNVRTGGTGHNRVVIEVYKCFKILNKLGQSGEIVVLLLSVRLHSFAGCTLHGITVV